MVDWQFVWWISTTIFVWWIGNDLYVRTLSNLCGGYLPPYLHGGLAMIFMWELYPICVVDIYHHICMVDWQ
jgi:hypothetical protein